MLSTAHHMVSDWSVKYFIRGSCGYKSVMLSQVFVFQNAIFYRHLSIQMINYKANLRMSIPLANLFPSSMDYLFQKVESAINDGLAGHNLQLELIKNVYHNVYQTVINTGHAEDETVKKKLMICFYCIEKIEMYLKSEKVNETTAQLDAQVYLYYLKQHYHNFFLKLK